MTLNGYIGKGKRVHRFFALEMGPQRLYPLCGRAGEAGLTDKPVDCRACLRSLAQAVYLEGALREIQRVQARKETGNA